MKTSFLSLLSVIIFGNAHAQLSLYPGLPANHLKSAKFEVKAKLSDSPNYESSYVYQYLVNVGTSSNNNVGDPYNISTPVKRDVLTNNHWTTMSYKNNGQTLMVEVAKIGSAITSCEITPSRYNLKATLANGKAYITIDKHDTYLYLKVNGDKKDPLFIFVDPQETNVPTASTSTIEYFGPGIHTIGEKYTFPAGKNEIYIAGGAYVKGTIWASGKSNITVRGRGILSAEGYNYRSGSGGIPWCAVMFEGSGSNQLVEGITSMKPLHFHILSRGTIKTNNVKCFSYNNTTDGWGGGDNSELRMSFFKVNDDVTKLYADNMKLYDIICYHQTNTPIFEYGWGGQEAQNCIVDGLDIIEDNHVDALADNGGIIGWASSDGNKVHKGHIFRNFRSDCAVNFIYDIENKSTDVCEFALENWNIKSLRIKDASGYNTKVTYKCVRVGDKYISDASNVNAQSTASFTFLNQQCLPLAANRQPINQKVSLCPNPVTNSFKIQHTETSDLSIRVFSPAGVLLMARVVQPNSEIDISDFEKGSYLVEVESQNSKQIKKLLKY